MFYEQEILKSRKYGVATIWLVATVGSKSVSRKVNRKEILQVNVPKACRVIITSEIPLALRLQSNLLYGVSRVYDQQCSYVLADAKSTMLSMKQLMSVTHFAADGAEGFRKIKSKDLLLQDDPTYLPEFAFSGLDMDILDQKTLHEQFTQSPKASLLETSSSSNLIRRSAPSLMGLSSDLENSSAIAAPEIGIRASEGLSEPARDPASEGERSLVDLENIDFAFDSEGNLFNVESNMPGIKTMTTFSDQKPKTAVSSQSREYPSFAEEEHAIENTDKVQSRIEERGDMQMQEHEPNVSVSHPSLPMDTRTAAIQSQDMHTPSLDRPQLRRSRRTKKLLLDHVTELDDVNIRDRTSNYSLALSDSKLVKVSRRSVSHAKSNAQYWIWCSLGQIEKDIPKSNHCHPLHVFHGEKLRACLNPDLSNSINLKRKRDNFETKISNDDNLYGDERESVNKRIEHVIVDQVLDEHDNFQDHDHDLEIGRGIETPLSDNADLDTSLMMPWNMSVISVGSPSTQPQYTRRRSSMIPERLSSASKQGIVRMSRTTTSRHVTPSPISNFSTRHQQRLSQYGNRFSQSSISVPLIGSASQSGLFHERSGLENQGNETSLPSWLDESSPPHISNPTTLDRSLSAINQDCKNFLEYCKLKIDNLTYSLSIGQSDDPGNDSEKSVVHEISFRLIIPPTTSTNVIAAQGLLNVLVLATRGFMNIRQEDSFGDIFLSVTNPSD